MTGGWQKTWKKEKQQQREGDASINVSFLIINKYYVGKRTFQNP